MEDTCRKVFGLFCVFLAIHLSDLAAPEQGNWVLKLSKENNTTGVYKTLYTNTFVSLKVSCLSKDQFKINVSWVFRYSPCMNEYIGIMGNKGSLASYYYRNTTCPSEVCPSLYPVIKRQVNNITNTITCDKTSAVFYIHPEVDVVYSKIPLVAPTSQTKTSDTNAAAGKLNNEANLKAGGKTHEPTKPKNRKKRAEETTTTAKKVSKNNKHKKGNKGNNDSKNQKPTTPKVKNNSKATKTSKTEKNHSKKSPKGTVKDDHTTQLMPAGINKDDNHICSSWQDGEYLFIIHVDPVGIMDSNKNFELTADLTIHGKYGYLSAIDWPLLVFYGVMGLVYIFYAIAWLVMSIMNWRDMLRIQFWIGGVIFLGLIEKAVFYSEYENINSTGNSIKGALIFAEVVSSVKRALARILVVIVSLGFGITKPRLGPALHKVLGVGLLYFICSIIEASVRIYQPKTDPGQKALFAIIPLSVLEAGIAWWVFSSLLQTMRTLRLRRNVIKLTLYRHFTNTLIFAVIASVVFMIWATVEHKMAKCLDAWHSLWIDDAYWHLLFSLILLVIMILWRPTANNQRYAFSPLLDTADDEDEEEDQKVNDAYAGMKMRGLKDTTFKTKDKEAKLEDDLKWIDENIPASVADTALPSLLDSDEEIMTTKYEMSKME